VVFLYKLLKATQEFLKKNKRVIIARYHLLDNALEAKVEAMGTKMESMDLKVVHAKLFVTHQGIVI